MHFLCSAFPPSRVTLGSGTRYQRCQMKPYTEREAQAAVLDVEPLFALRAQLQEARADIARLASQLARSEAERDRARAQHDAFLREHSGTTAAETPLLLYDPSQTPPFTCVRCS